MSDDSRQKGSLKSLSRLLSKGREEEFRRGDSIFLRGDPAENVYLVREGRVNLTTSSNSGREIVVTTVGPGEVFGEECLLRSPTHAFEARAAEPTTAVRIDATVALESLRSSKTTARYLLEGWSNALARARRRSADQLLYRVHQRLAWLLLELAGRLGIEEEEGVRIPHWFTHQELADLIGAHRSTITTVLNDWLYEGILSDQGRQIVISEPGRLREIAEEHGS